VCTNRIGARGNPRIPITTHGILGRSSDDYPGAILRAILILFAFISFAAPSAGRTEQATKVAASRTQIVDGLSTIEVVDLCPQFLDFYQAAVGADPATRWKLWGERYGFAAVPPTPQGKELAHHMLDAAWPRYAKILPLIRQGAASVEPKPQEVLRKVAVLLALDRPYSMQVTVYVGAFDNNAFSFRQGGKSIVAIPLEMNNKRRELVFTHEMTHAVQLEIAGLAGGWERSIAETVFLEGLAMHAVEALVPGHEAHEYVDSDPAWFSAAMAKSREILAGILPELEKSDSNTVTRFTYGQGTTGTIREAYVAGWIVIGDLLQQGKSFPELARIRSADMPAITRSAVAHWLAQKKTNALR
jgi:Predicted Zn-dependent protease (DUF2268)